MKLVVQRPREHLEKYFNEHRTVRILLSNRYE